MNRDLIELKQAALSGSSRGKKQPKNRAHRGIDTNTQAGARLIDENKPLTDQMKRFVKFWAEGESITTASFRAGYNDNASYCYRLSVMPNVLKAYRAEKVLYEEASQMTRKRVMDGLLEAIDAARMVSEPSAMVAGWREIGKLCGYFEPVKSRVDVHVHGMKRMEGLSDAELLKMIKEGVSGDLLQLEHAEDADD